MHRQIRATVLILCLLSAAVVLTACSKQEKTATEQPALEAVEYSNLTDEDSRKQLSELLTDAGIEESRIAALLNRVEQFNASVKSEWQHGAVIVDAVGVPARAAVARRRD